LHETIILPNQLLLEKIVATLEKIRLNMIYSRITITFPIGAFSMIFNGMFTMY